VTTKTASGEDITFTAKIERIAHWKVVAPVAAVPEVKVGQRVVVCLDLSVKESDRAYSAGSVKEVLNTNPRTWRIACEAGGKKVDAGAEAIYFLVTGPDQVPVGKEVLVEHDRAFVRAKVESKSAADQFVLSWWKGTIVARSGQIALLK